MEKTLTLHSLGKFLKLDISFKTNNYIENVINLVGIYYTGRVSY
jgi:hypothetical protein